MASNYPEVEESEEIFIDQNTAIDRDKTIQRLREFSYYLVEEMEGNLEFCLNHLEGRKVPVKPTSKYVFALSKMALAIPYVGSGLSNALPQIENFFLNRIDMKNAKTLGDLVHFYNDNKDRFRQIIIEAAIETFCSFEDQFKKITCEGGDARAMQKLAKTAAGRIMNYLLGTGQGVNLTKVQIVKGILEGDTKSDRTIKKDEENWKTTKVFTKTGLVNVETSTFYEKSNSNPKKYGHRRPFSWESKEEIEKKYEVDSNTYVIPKYFLCCSDETLTDDIRKYIMSKDPFEEAKLDREHNVEKLSEETTKHYEAVVTFLNEHFHEVLDEMTIQFCTSLNFQKTHTVMLDTVLENQEKDKKTTAEIATTLENIQQTVEQTAGNQIVLIGTTAEIREDVNVIKESQNEISVKQNELERALEERSLENELSELIKGNIPRIEREIDRSKGKLLRELDRFKNRGFKF